MEPVTRQHIHAVMSETPTIQNSWIAVAATNEDFHFRLEQDNISMIFDDEREEYKPTHIVRDRDNKFTAQFCSILESDGIEFRPIPPRSPNMNPFAEVWVQRTKHEVLNHFMVFGEKHLRHLMHEWVTYYHTVRPHQGLGNVPITGSLPPPSPLESFRLEHVECQARLGGLLKHYERKAA